MIKTNNIDEYASLKVLTNYCKEYRDNDCCEECKIKELCSCMAYNPGQLKIEYEKEVENNG